MSSVKTPRQSFLEAAGKIKELGFSVYIPSDETLTYGYFSAEGKVGYFQRCEHEPGIQIAIVNKTPGSFGLHLFVEPNGEPKKLAELNKEYLVKAFADYPDYFTKEDREMMPNIKYADIREFLSMNRDGDALVVL